jgi:hypothetical protein
MLHVLIGIETGLRKTPSYSNSLSHLWIEKLMVQCYLLQGINVKIPHGLGREGS